MIQGSGATGDCCSKCWNEKQKKEGTASTATTEIQKSMNVVAEQPSPMEVEAVVEDRTEEVSAEAPKKRKKKKTSYKTMMAGITQGTPGSKDIEQERERLRQVTGGGTFSKIDKI